MSVSESDAIRYQQVLDRLYSRLNYEKTPDAARTLDDFRLTQMQELLTGLGEPQLSVPTVHVAGSKGKGSTSTMIAKIAESAGYRVGLFTSPHVNRFEERFTINGIPPTHRELADLYDRLEPVVDSITLHSESGGPTFFELATALGWMFFAEQKVDLAVMEVGLGGRLDSTNLCQPLVTVITSISRDHTRLLGDTLAKIAREKAGIIKPGIPILTAVTEAEPLQVIEEVAREKHAPIFRLGMEFQHTPQPVTDGASREPICSQFDFNGLKVQWKGIQTGMPGEHQTRNGSLAIATALQLRDKGFTLSEDAIRTGLQRACCPLRVEVISRSPLIIVDAAHNPASMTALCTTLKPVKAGRRIAIFASSRDKEVDVLLQILNEQVDEIWLTQFTTSSRSIALAELQQIAQRVLTTSWRIFETPHQALRTAKESLQEQDLICCTGSFFLAAEAKSILLSPQNEQ